MGKKMTKEQKDKLMKWSVVVGMAGYMVYVARKNGGSLAGNPQGYKVRLDTDMMVDVAAGVLQMNPFFKPLIKNGAKNILNHARNKYGVNL